MASTINAINGSYRDPMGHVYRVGHHIYRTILPEAKDIYEWGRDQDLYRAAQKHKFLIPTEELATNDVPDTLQSASYVLSHQLLQYVSWPYEWSFFQLQDAALFHLDFQLFLLDKDAVLVDASAYNIQFIGKTPIFIDLLSIRRYKDREYWTAYRQFCESFLNPLLLRSTKGISYNSWYRGALEGISAKDLNAVLSWMDKLSLNMFSHVTLQSKFEARVLQDPARSTKQAQQAKGISRDAYKHILRQMRQWIASLKPRGYKKTVWGEYATHNTYLLQETQQKEEIVKTFCETHKPALLYDLGCNSGHYSRVALDSGAEYVVGFDFDHQAIETAYSQKANRNNFLPLWFDASNPSPNQGWMQQEREGFLERAKPNALIALAFEHHLAIAKNVPLNQVVDWFLQIAPQGLIEFVPKEDETVQQLLALREDIFKEYSYENFKALIGRQATIVNCTQITASGRVLIEYKR